MSRSDLLETLAAIVGHDHVLTAATDRAPYETGARHDAGQAAFVVRPASTSEVSAVMAACIGAGTQLVPQSGNTGLVGGSTPDGAGDQGVLSLERLRTPTVIDPVNRTAIVAAGTRLSSLNDALAPHDLHFPIDLGADPMVGGMVATNTGGARFIRYGDVRRNILGLEVVLPDANGTVLDLMQVVRKNNTGIDLKQMFIGTSGAMGVVTRAVLELHRRPQQRAAALLVPASDDSILQLLAAFERDAGDYLTAFEGMSREAMQAAFAHAPSLRNPFSQGRIPEYAILVELSRTWPARDAEMPLESVLEGLLASIWERADAPLADAMIGRPEGLWHLRHALSEGVRHAGYVIAFDLAFTRGDLVRFRRTIRPWLREKYPMLQICDFGHIGDGGLHFNLVHPVGNGTRPLPGFVQRLRSELIERAVVGYGASFSGEHAIGRSNQGFYDRHAPDAIKTIAGRIQRVFAAQPFGAARFGPADESDPTSTTPRSEEAHP